MNIHTILLLLFVNLSFCLFSNESFNSHVLCLLDEKNHTYLFRGKIPLKDGEFCNTELRDEIQKYLAKYDKPISSNFKLICVSLLNIFADRKACSIESEWFSCHSDRGFVWRYPLFGYGCSPSFFSKHLRKVFYLTDVDGVRCLLRQLNRFVNIDYGEDVVIYMHCNAGKDRTGEASACYLMQYLSYSYQEAISFCEEVAKRKLRLMSLNAIRWHAYYLRDVCLMPSIGVIDE